MCMESKRESMKITVKMDKNCKENEVVIKCSEIDEEVIHIQKVISTQSNSNMKMELFKNHVEFYEEIENIIFFETEDDVVKAHTRRDIFSTKYRLYELEQLSLIHIYLYYQRKT